MSLTWGIVESMAMLVFTVLMVMAFYFRAISEHPIAFRHYAVMIFGALVFAYIGIYEFVYEVFGAWWITFVFPWVIFSVYIFIFVLIYYYAKYLLKKYNLKHPRNRIVEWWRERLQEISDARKGKLDD